MTILQFRLPCDRDADDHITLAGQPVHQGLKRCEQRVEQRRALARTDRFDLLAEDRVYAQRLACPKVGSSRLPLVIQRKVEAGRVAGEPLEPVSLIDPGIAASKLG